MTNSPRNSSEVDDLVSAALALTLSVRNRRGLAEEEVEALFAALAECERAWAGRDAIPRSAVNVLVDLQPSLMASADVYEPDTRDRIRETAVHLGDRIREAVAL